MFPWSHCSHLSSSHKPWSDLLLASSVKAPTTISSCLLRSITLWLILFHLSHWKFILFFLIILLFLLDFPLSSWPPPPAIVFSAATTTGSSAGLLFCFVSHGSQVAWWVLQEKVRVITYVNLQKPCKLMRNSNWFTYGTIYTCKKLRWYFLHILFKHAALTKNSSLTWTERPCFLILSIPSGVHGAGSWSSRLSRYRHTK